MNALLPQHVDANEWFIMLVIIGSYPLAWILPRRFPAIVSMTVLSLGLGVSVFADSVLAAPPLDLFDCNDTDKFELFDFLNYAQFPPYAYIFVYMYDRLKINGLYKVLYVLLWALTGTFAEFLAVRFHVFDFSKGWSLRYSFVFYLILQPLILLLFSHFKKTYNRMRLPTGYEWK